MCLLIHLVYLDLKTKPLRKLFIGICCMMTKLFMYENACGFIVTRDKMLGNWNIGLLGLYVAT